MHWEACKLHSKQLSMYKHMQGPQHDYGTQPSCPELVLVNDSCES